MNGSFLWLAVPVLLSILVAFFATTIRRRPLATGIILAGIYLTGAVCLLPLVGRQETAFFAHPWVPVLGVDFALRITPFSAWFAILILALGAAILLYAASYFTKNHRLPSLLACLLLFTSAMLGVVWADNFYLLFLFWEGTSLFSFLLVGFHHVEASVRWKASQGLLVTLLGGAVMLAGLVMLHLETGVSQFSHLGNIPVNAISTAAMVCLVIGALSKSAQFPFHFWLPNAMAGPTPVSAFLHSATMVKAGVFLLAILAPHFREYPGWTPLLVTSGGLTLAFAIRRGLTETDLKAILACTTLAALGFLTVLAGIGSQAALAAFVIFLTAHALYKAPLFLAAGNLEKRFGTRELPKLRGTLRLAPVTGAVILVSLASLLGIPPFPGFLGKEYFLKAAWKLHPALAIAGGVAAAGVLAIGLRLLWSLAARGRNTSFYQPIPRGMTAAAVWPALLVLVGTALFSLVNSGLLVPAASALSGKTADAYSYWHGWTPALLLSLAAWIVALAFLWLASRKTSAGSSAIEDLYNSTMEALLRLGKWIGSLLEDGALSQQLGIMITAIGALSLVSLDIGHWPSIDRYHAPDSIVFLLLCPALAIAAITAATARTALAILVSLGLVGLLIAFFFLWFSAPDLALTQLLAETLLLFLIAGVLLKKKPTQSTRMGTFWRAGIGLGATALISALILKAMALEWDHPISEFYLEKSLSEGFGANVVNVILVDFRALDTLGEIVVLAIAALGANAALGAPRNRAPIPGTLSTPWINSGLSLIMIMLLPTALWILWRGHNAPGGGFIAALLVGIAIGLGLLAERREFTPSRLRRLSRTLLLTGLLLAVIPSLLPLLSGRPFFTGLWWHPGSMHLGTPLLFDLGVFLTVIGFTVSYLRHFHLNRIPAWNS